MNTKRIFALWSLCVVGMGLVGPGCVVPECPPGFVHIDNRERQTFPSVDEDWLCLEYFSVLSPPPPPPPPDVSSVSPPDPPGPKDADAVVKAAIAQMSCYDPPHYGNVNWVIAGLYLSQPARPMAAALAQRTSCFKDMANGCETYRECMGIATSFDAPLDPTPCKDGIAYKEIMPSTGLVGHMWRNCAALGYECQVDPYYNRFGFCSHPNRRDCDIKQDPARVCVDGEYQACIYEPASPTNGITFDLPRCSDYGLECSTDFGNIYFYCRGSGPECYYWAPHYEDSIFEYRTGIACESDTVMRGCVGGTEHVIDCSSLSPDFKCLPTPGWLKADCGFAKECTEDDNPTCEGTSLVVCDAGRIRKVDCKALGFDSCSADYGYCK